MEHLLAGSGGSIDSLLQADQIDLSGFDVRDPTLLPFTSPLGLDDTILSRDFDWHFGAAERQIARPLHIGSAIE